MSRDIKVGDRVRSHDFPDSRHLEGREPCFIDGTVEAITDRRTHERFRDCDRYAIRVERRVFSGKEIHERIGGLVFPPVNGTPIWGDPNDLTHGVELLERGES